MSHILPVLLLALAVPVWGQSPAPIQIHIERVQDKPALLLDLTSTNPLMVEGIGFIQLSGETDKFWAAFSLADFKPIKANRTSRRQLDGSMNRQRVESNKVPLTLPVKGQTAHPYRFGPYAANMTPEVLAAVLQAASSDGRQPWALSASWGAAMDPRTQAFYPPHTSTERVRRGVFRTLRCPSTPSPERCLAWEPVGQLGNYVQIAEKGAFAKPLRPRSAGEKPIMFTGRFSDADFLTLVDYLKSSRSVLPEFSMCGDDPIWEIVRKTPGVVEVIFSDAGVGGCTAAIRQTGSQWAVVKCGCWVS